MPVYQQMTAEFEFSDDWSAPRNSMTKSSDVSVKTCDQTTTTRSSEESIQACEFTVKKISDGSGNTSSTKGSSRTKLLRKYATVRHLRLKKNDDGNKSTEHRTQAMLSRMQSLRNLENKRHSLSSLEPYNLDRSTGRRFSDIQTECREMHLTKQTPFVVELEKEGIIEVVDGWIQPSEAPTASKINRSLKKLDSFVKGKVKNGDLLEDNGAFSFWK